MSVIYVGAIFSINLQELLQHRLHGATTQKTTIFAVFFCFPDCWLISSTHSVISTQVSPLPLSKC